MGPYEEPGQDEEEELVWRKCPDDFETLAVTETLDPGTFAANCLVTPIVTSSVFLLNGPAAQQGEHGVSVLCQLELF